MLAPTDRIYVKVVQVTDMNSGWCFLFRAESGPWEPLSNGMLLFQRLVREIVQDYKADIRFQSGQGL